MRTTTRIAVLLFCVAAPSAAQAQRLAFERTIQVSGPVTVDVSTIRGKIEIVPGDTGRVVVEGAATVRVGWDVPANAVEIAKRVADAPPIEHVGDTVRLRAPAEPDARRAVTVNYLVHVPPNSQVRTASDSGETSIHGVTANVDVQTQSATIEVRELSGTLQVSTGSGSVTVSDISGATSVTTASSSITGLHLRSSFRARTKSGEINATLDGSGDVDVETGSSAIKLAGVSGGLLVKTQSGRVTVQGNPTGNWSATTSSSSVRFELQKGVGFELDAVSRSGSVTLAEATPSGAVTKRSAKGAVGGGGPTVLVRSGSGAIHIQSGDR